MKRRIFISYFLLLTVIISVSQFLGTNLGAGTIARLATIESLVERGTPDIDGASLPPTPDKVLIDGRLYGGQLPFLQYAAAPLYGALKSVFGLSLSEDTRLVYAVITIGTVGLLSSLMVAFFFDLMSVFGLTGRRALQSAAALGLGTLVLPYSTVFNPHIIAAAFIFFALRLLFRGPRSYGAFSMGLLIGAALVIDPVPGGAFCVALLFFFTCGAARRRLLLPFLAGVLVPLVVHCFISIRSFGTVLPVNIYPAHYRYPGSIFDETSLSGVASHASLAGFLEYCYHAVAGRRGLFSYNPVLVFPLVTLLWCAFSRREGGRRPEAIVIISASAATVFCYLLKTVNYGGWSFGMRFFVPLIPAVAIYLGPFLAKRRRLLVRALFVLSLCFSVAVSLIGVMGPWTDMYIGPNPVVNNLVMAFGNLGVRPPSILAGMAMGINGGDAESLYRLGKKFYLYGWKEHARDAYLMALRAEPGSPAVRISLGNVFCDLRDTSAALEHYTFQISNYPEYVGGVVEYDAGRGLCVARVTEEDVVARRNVARLLAAEGRAAEARDLLRDYLERGEDRLRERCRSTYPEGEIEVVHPASRADLLLLLEHLEQ